MHLYLQFCGCVKARNAYDNESEIAVACPAASDEYVQCDGCGVHWQANG